MMKAIVLAGGGGTRLWPVSQEHYPKQFIKLWDHHSLFQKTILRLHQSAIINDLFVVTNADFVNLVQEQLLEIDKILPNNIITEPVRRNTAPAIALAAKYAQEVQGATLDDVLLLLPSDHRLEATPELWAQMGLAEQLARQGLMVTFGVVPSRPETGYGYIKIQGEQDLNLNVGTDTYFEIAQFTEKPDVKTATEFVTSGQHLWNSGMFAFTLRSLYQALEKYAPEINELMSLDYEALYAVFAQMPNISFDYAVMEHVQNAVVIPLAVQWSDVGCWDSIYECFEKDQNNNVLLGDVLELDTSNSLIMNQSKRIIATIGLDDLVIIDTPNALLIAKKGETQKVKNLVEQAYITEALTDPLPQTISVSP